MLAYRAIFFPAVPAVSTQPMTTSSISPPSAPERATAFLIAWPKSVGDFVALKAPLNARPIGVLAVETMTASLMSCFRPSAECRGVPVAQIAVARLSGVVSRPSGAGSRRFSARMDFGSALDPPISVQHRPVPCYAGSPFGTQTRRRFGCRGTFLAIDLFEAAFATRKISPTHVPSVVSADRKKEYSYLHSNARLRRA